MKNEVAQIVRQSLAKAIREQINKHADRLVELRKAELEKAVITALPPNSVGNDSAHPAFMQFLGNIPDHTQAHQEAMDSWSRASTVGAPSPHVSSNTADIKTPPAKAGGSVDWKSVVKSEEMNKAEDYLKISESNNRDKRTVTIGGKGAVLPEDKPSKKIEAKGSGGQIKKGKKLEKADGLPTNKPPKISAPAIPTAKPPTGQVGPAKPPTGNSAAKMNTKLGKADSMPLVKAPTLGSPPKPTSLPPSLTGKGSTETGLGKADKCAYCKKSEHSGDCK